VTQERQTKIAVIGAAGPRHESGEARVEWFPWNRLKKLTNLADYDSVILDLLSMTDQTLQDGETFDSILNEQSMLEVLVSKNQERPNGAIFVLGDPRFCIPGEVDTVPMPFSPPYGGAEVSDDDTAPSHGRKEIPFLYWTNMEFEWDDRPGDTIERAWEASAGKFKPFVDKLGRWQYSLNKCHLKSDVPDEFLPVESLHGIAYDQKALVETICGSRYGTSIVFSVRIVAEGRSGRSKGRIGNPPPNPPPVVPVTGPIYFLPKSRLTEEEMLEFVLRGICGIDISAPEPEWVSEFVVPGQEEVDRQITELEVRIEELREDHARKVEKRAEVRKPLGLLYETGAALEATVRSVLEALGAEVETPGEDRANEDGWITVQVGDQTFEGVLEIKGVKTKHFNVEGLRQLVEWIERGWTFREKTYTGIFVGNSSREDPPHRRVWPFNPNWVKQAKMRGHVGIRSEDLYILYLLDQTDRLDRNEFWRELFCTKGPFDMREYCKKLTQEEKANLENLPQA
jgi:hypothetical protein